MMQLDVPVYWINLQSAVTRRAHMQTSLAAVPHATRVPAVSTRAVRRMLKRGALVVDNAHVVDTLVQSEPHVRHSRRQVIFPEIACTMSHLRVMEHAVQDNVGVALVLEDDMDLVSLSSRLAAPISHLAQRAPLNWDILQLHMLNVRRYEEELCGEKQDFTPWRTDHWSTGAYLVTNAGMRTLLNATRRSGGWTLPAPVVADHFLFSRVATYTVTRPLLSSYSTHDTSIQPKKAHAALRDGEDSLWRRLRQGTLNCSLHMRPVSTRFLSIVTASLSDMAMQRRNAYVIAKTFGPGTIFVVVCADRRCDAWQPFRRRIAATLALQVVLVDDEYSSGNFQSKLLAQIDAFRMVRSYAHAVEKVFIFDGDIDLHRPQFDLLRFVNGSRGAALSQPLVDVSIPTYLWGGQWFKPLNGMYWDARPGRHAVRCAVPIVEQQVVLADAAFLSWFVERTELNGVFDAQTLTPTDWGHDLLWCKAAMEYNRSGLPCAVVLTDRVYHANTKTIRKDAAYEAAGTRMLRLLSTSRWYSDPERAQRTWNDRACAAVRTTPWWLSQSPSSELWD